jgi:hypothetical protein
MYSKSICTLYLVNQGDKERGTDIIVNKMSTGQCQSPSSVDHRLWPVRSKYVCILYIVWYALRAGQMALSVPRRDGRWEFGAASHAFEVPPLPFC